jgi:phosphate transport system substrate-binding protein
MTFTEYLQFERLFNYDPLEIPLATGSLDTPGWSDAMCIVVNKDNPLTKLTLEQLDGIFGGPREGGWIGTAWHPELARGPDKNIRTWGQLGLKGEWKDKPIHPWGPVVRYDTATKFSDRVLASSDDWNENTHMVANIGRPDGTFDIWAAQIAAAVGKNRYAIGYTGHAYVSADTKVIAIQFRTGGPYVEPTLQTLYDRSYELFQANYWYINRAPGHSLDPKVKEYLRYVLSQEGQLQVIRDGKYIPLNKQLVDKALASLE